MYCTINRSNINKRQITFQKKVNEDEDETHLIDINRIEQRNKQNTTIKPMNSKDEIPLANVDIMPTFGVVYKENKIIKEGKSFDENPSYDGKLLSQTNIVKFRQSHYSSLKEGSSLGQLLKSSKNDKTIDLLDQSTSFQKGFKSNGFKGIQKQGFNKQNEKVKEHINNKDHSMFFESEDQRKENAQLKSIFPKCIKTFNTSSSLGNRIPQIKKKGRISLGALDIFEQKYSESNSSIKKEDHMEIARKTFFRSMSSHYNKTYYQRYRSSTKYINKK